MTRRKQLGAMDQSNISSVRDNFLWLCLISSITANNHPREEAMFPSSPSPGERVSLGRVTLHDSWARRSLYKSCWSFIYLALSSTRKSRLPCSLAHSPILPSTLSLSLSFFPSSGCVYLSEFSGYSARNSSCWPPCLCSRCGEKGKRGMGNAETASLRLRP